MEIIKTASREDLIKELELGDGVYYLAQERAFAPGIVKEWPNVIPHPSDPNGRLLKRIFPKSSAEEPIPYE